MTDKPKPRFSTKSRRLLWLGTILTSLYLVLLGLYSYHSIHKMRALPPNELGDFLAGAFSPLAFLWLVLGYLQQGKELENSANALWLQGQELQNSVKQQRELVQVTREQLEHERETAIAAERRIIAEIEGEKSRLLKAATDEHNSLIRRILTLGVLASEEIKDQIGEFEKKYGTNENNVSFDFNTKCVIELIQFLPSIKSKTTNIKLLYAITELQNKLDDNFVSGPGLLVVKISNEKLARIDLALSHIESLMEK